MLDEELRFPQPKFSRFISRIMGPLCDYLGTTTMYNTGTRILD